MRFYVQITAVNYIKFLRTARTVGDAGPYRFDGVYSQDKSRELRKISLFCSCELRSPDVAMTFIPHIAAIISQNCRDRRPRLSEPHEEI